MFSIYLNLGQSREIEEKGQHYEEESEKMVYYSSTPAESVDPPIEGEEPGDAFVVQLVQDKMGEET